VFRVSQGVYDAVQPAIEKPSLFSVLGAAINLGGFLIDLSSRYTSDYFEGEDWVALHSSEFNMLICTVLQRYPRRILKSLGDSTNGNSSQNVIEILDVDGIEFGWVFNEKLSIVGSVYVRPQQLEEAKNCIKQKLWEHFKGASIVMRYKKNNWLDQDATGSNVSFGVDDTINPLPSKKSVEYSDYLRGPISSGVHRNVLFYGPPGTGKSTLARKICETLGLRSFRISIGDMNRIENSVLFEAVAVFEPDAIILDDFDRSTDQAVLLEILEFFEKKVKLVLATVNDRSELDEAILRPGRFDELVEIDRMDEEVVKHVLGEYVDSFDTVKNWPISFVNEFVVRCKFMDQKGAADSVVELANRVKRLDVYKDTSDIERLFDSQAKSTRLVDNKKSVKKALNKGSFDDVTPPAIKTTKKKKR
jgi:adenylate kinase family enzyme